MNRDVEFLYEIGSLRYVLRTWRQFLNADLSNVAEHTLRVAWIALLIAKKEKANEEKVLKMALVHDVPESRTGDVHYVGRLYVERHEDLACRDIFDQTALDQEMVELWHEAEAKQTLEAKIVKDADNLDVELELKEQAACGYNLQEIWGENRQKAVFARLYTQTAKDLWKAIRNSKPHDWHLNAKNRFTSGDWKDKPKK